MRPGTIRKVRWWALGAAVVVAIGLVLTLGRGEDGTETDAPATQTSLDELRSETRRVTPYDPNTTLRHLTTTTTSTTTTR